MPPLRQHLPALLGAALVLGSIGCGKGDEPRTRTMSNARDGGAGPVPVEVVTLRTGPIEDALRFSATLRAENQVQVLARTPGHVRAHLFEEGQKVAANQVMVRLESEEQASAVRRTRVELAQAKKNLNKQKQLKDSGVVSAQSLEQAEFEVERLTIAHGDAARALRYTTIRSPIAGVVTLRTVKKGDFVNPGQPLYQVTALSSLVAEVYVPEKDIARVAVGSTARLTAPTTGQELREGEVDRVAPVVDPRTGTVKVTVSVPEGGTLRPGMFVDVALLVAQRTDAVLLPRRALVYDNDEPYAFKVVAGDVVERIRVEARVEDRDNVEPVSGFAAGDRVVVAGQVGLKDGAEVKTQPAANGAETAEQRKPAETEEPAVERETAGP